MLDQSDLKLYVCPATRQALSLADPDLVRRLNRMIQEHQLQDCSGKEVKEGFEEGLIRADGTVLYRVREGIPILLAEEGIPLKGVSP